MLQKRDKSYVKIFNQFLNKMSKIYTGNQIIYQGFKYYVRHYGTILYLYKSIWDLMLKQNRKKVIANRNIFIVKTQEQYTFPADWDDYTEESDTEKAIDDEYIFRNT